MWKPSGFVLGSTWLIHMVQTLYIDWKMSIWSDKHKHTYGKSKWFPARTCWSFIYVLVLMWRVQIQLNERKKSLHWEVTEPFRRQDLFLYVTLLLSTPSPMGTFMCKVVWQSGLLDNTHKIHTRKCCTGDHSTVWLYRQMILLLSRQGQL